MKRLSFFAVFLLIPGILLARNYDASALRYTDVTDATVDGGIAISTLTAMGIVEGNPDGSFRPHAPLNRAEFIKIVMGLVPDDGTPYGLRCFPDVPPGAWYAAPVCRAKALGIVSGDDLPGTSAGDRPFVAGRSVNLAEAVKILVEVFNLPVQVQLPDDPWYIGYFEAARSILETDAPLSSATAGTILTRQEMARLTVSFLAYDEGELEQYRRAEDGTTTSSSKSSVSSPSSEFSVSSSSSESSTSSTSPASSHIRSASYDPDSDVSQSANILLLGDSASSVLAAVSVLPDAEPLVLRTITVVLSASVSSIDSLLVYDHVGRFLGRAFRESGGTYMLSVKNSSITIPRREEYSFYVRARLKPFQAGGVSGETFTVSSATVEGDGAWSNRSYTKSSDDTFPTFQTARSAITAISNPDDDREALTEGGGLVIGSYLFRGIRGDGSAALAVTDITFTLTTVGGVSISNPKIVRQGVSLQHSCSVSSFSVTCSSIPQSIGAFEDGPLIVELMADVDVSSNAVRAALSANINQPGSPDTAGDIAWTDGSTSLTWVPFPSPVVRGTTYEQ